MEELRPALDQQAEAIRKKKEEERRRVERMTPEGMFDRFLTFTNTFTGMGQLCV